MQPDLELTLDPEGLAFLVDVDVRNVPAVEAKLLKDGRKVPEPQRVLALVDTGAAYCNAAPSLIAALSLPSKSEQMTLIETGGGTVTSKPYIAAVAVVPAPALKCDYFTVTALSHLEKMPFKFILGMTVLMRWDWRYDHYARRLSIFEPR